MTKLADYINEGYQVFDIINSENKILFKEDEDDPILYNTQENTFFLHDEESELVEYTKVYIKFLSRKHPKIGSILFQKLETNNWIQITNFYNRILRNKELFLKEKEKILEKEDALLNYIELKRGNGIIDLNSVLNIPMMYEKDSEYLNHISKGILLNDKKLIIKKIKEIAENRLLINVLSNCTMESVEDLMDIMEKNHEYQLIIKNELTTNNKKIWSEECFEILKEMAGPDFKAKDFHEEFGKKIAKYKTSEELFSGLKKFKIARDGWNKKSYIKKFKDEGIEYIELENNLIAAKIFNYDQSNKFGSSSWCISTSSYQFNNYNNQTLSRQFFIYDFNKEAEDPLSMIGITLTPEGKTKAAHNRKDGCVKYEKSTEDIKSKLPKMSTEDKYHCLLKKYQKIEEQSTLGSSKRSKVKKFLRLKNEMENAIGKEYGEKFKSFIMSKMSDKEKMDFLYISGEKNKKEMTLIKQKVSEDIMNSKNPKQEFKKVFHQIYDRKKNSFDFVMNWVKEFDMVEVFEPNYFYTQIISHGSQMDLLTNQWSTLSKDLKIKIGSHLLKETSYDESSKIKRDIRLYEDLGKLVINENLKDSLDYIKENHSVFFSQSKRRVYNRIARGNPKNNYLANHKVREAINEAEFFEGVLTSDFKNDNEENIKSNMQDEIQTEVCILALNRYSIASFRNLNPNKINWKIVFENKNDALSNLRVLVKTINSNDDWFKNKNLKKELSSFIKEKKIEEALFVDYIDKTRKNNKHKIA